MSAESIESEGFEKLSNIIKEKERDMKRFKDGFTLTIKRNLDNKIITEYQAQLLRMTLQTMKV